MGDNDVFTTTPSSAGFLMTSLPPLYTTDPSTTTSRAGSLSDGMDLSDEELGQFSKVRACMLARLHHIVRLRIHALCLPFHSLFAHLSLL